MMYIVELEKKEHYYDTEHNMDSVRNQSENMVVVGKERAIETLNQYWNELFSLTFARTHQDSMNYHHHVDERDYETDRQAEADSWYCILKSDSIPRNLRATFDFQKNVMFDPEHYRNMRTFDFAEGYNPEQYVTALEENYDTLKEMWEALESRTFTVDVLHETKSGRAKSRWVQGKVSAGNQSSTIVCRIRLTTVGEPTERSSYELMCDEEHEAWLAWKNDPEEQAKERERKQRAAELQTTMGEMGHNCMSHNEDGSVSHWRE